RLEKTEPAAAHRAELSSWDTSSGSERGSPRNGPTRELRQGDGDFVLPCGLYQAQVMDLMYRPLTPEDYELLRALDETVPKRNTASRSSVAALVAELPNPEGSCGVCLESLRREVLRLPCSHAFHSACIEKWLTQFKNASGRLAGKRGAPFAPPHWRGLAPLAPARPPYARNVVTMSRRGEGRARFEQLRGLAQGRAWQRAVEELARANAEGEANVFHFGAVLGALAALSLWRQCLDLLKAVTSSRLETNVVLYSSCVTACEKGAQWLSASRLMQELAAGAVETDTKLHSAAMSSYAQASVWQSAMLAPLLQLALEVDVVALGAAASACERSLRWAPALELQASAGRWALRARGRALANASLSACAARWRRALQLLAGSEAEPDLIAHNAYINAAEKASRWQDAVCSLRRLPQRSLRADAFSLAGAIAAAGGGHWELASRLLTGEPLTATVACFNAYAAACGAAFQWRRALHVVPVMQARGSAEAVTCNAALTACQVATAWAGALRLLEAPALARSRDVISFSAAVTACCDAAHWRQAVELFACMQRTGVDVNGVVFAELARACGSASEWEAMLSITGQMRTKGFAPDALVLASASNAYQKAENLPRLLLALVELDARTTSLCQPSVEKEGSGCTCHVRVVRSQPRTRQHATQHVALGLDLLGSKPCAAPPRGQVRSLQRVAAQKQPGWSVHFAGFPSQS
ncbi:unnamed protein product, partial [Effrenium voratum]